jgi:hypothetical protein
MGLNGRQATTGPPKGFRWQSPDSTLDLFWGSLAWRPRDRLWLERPGVRVGQRVWLQPGWVRVAHKVFGETPQRSGRLEWPAGGEAWLRRWWRRVHLKREQLGAKAGPQHVGGIGAAQSGAARGGGTAQGRAARCAAGQRGAARRQSTCREYAMARRPNMAQRAAPAQRRAARREACLRDTVQPRGAHASERRGAASGSRRSAWRPQEALDQEEMPTGVALHRCQARGCARPRARMRSPERSRPQRW